MNEQQGLHDSQYKVVCRILFRIMAPKTLKNPYRFKTVTFKLSQKGKKTKIRKEKPKVTYSVALVMAFSRRKRQLEDLPQGDFGRVSERFPLSVRSKSITENFVC